MRKISSREVLDRSSPPSVFITDPKVSFTLMYPHVFTFSHIFSVCSLFSQVKLPLREEPVFRQHHPPPPSSSRSYDSPSSSSPASSNNDPPPPISRSAASFSRLPTPPPLNFNSSGKLWPLGMPPPPPPASMAEATGLSAAPLSGEQEEAAVESSMEDPCMSSFLGKIKAFEKMDHFARARRILEMQQAHNAKVDPAQRWAVIQSEGPRWVG